MEDITMQASLTLAIDITNTPAGASRRLTRKGTGSKIFEYFEKVTSPPGPKSAPITRQNSEDFSDANTLTPSSSATVVASDDATPADFHTDEMQAAIDSDAPKKYRITAGNGWQAANRLQLPSQKRIKRESSDNYRQIDPAGATLRRHNPRAKLAVLPSLPLDVLLEIFSNLLPLDILHLSRTTKALRKLLLHRSATSTWKASLKNFADLPECPEDMSLPSWVNLLFDSHCHNCLRPNVSKCLDILLRVRYCSKCVKTELSSKNDYRKDVKQDVIIRRAVPFSDWNHTGVKYCTKHARDRFLKDLDAYKGDRTIFLAERRAKIKANAKHAKICMKWYENMLDQREDELDEIRAERALDIRDKLLNLGYEKELEFLDEMEEMNCAIIPWPQIVMFDDHRHVKQPKPLTSKVWANIESPMVSYMEEARNLRVENERFLLYRRRRTTTYNAYLEWRRKPTNLMKYPADMLMPGPADILELPDVQYLIKQYGNENISEEDMEDLVADFPALTQRWTREKIQSLYRAVESPTRPSWDWLDNVTYFGDTKKKEETLKLAAIVFRCKRQSIHWLYEEKWAKDEGIPVSHAADPPDMREPCMWYPEFLFHPCCTTIFTPHNENRAGEHVYLRVHKEYSYCRRAVWNVPDRLEFDEKASRIVRNLLDSAGLKWERTTVEEMDKLDLRFVCMKCTFGNKCDGSRRVRVWPWRDAVQHISKSHFGDAQISWECISSKDSAEARDLEKAEGIKRRYLQPSQQKLWKCIRCRDTVHETGRLTMAQLRSHFTAMPAHGNVADLKDKEGVLYYKALDYGPREHPPVKMIPSAVVKR